MNPKTYKPFLFLLSILVITALACMGGGAPAVQPVLPSVPSSPSSGGDGISAAARSRLISATVQIIALKTINGNLTPIYGGSGTILSPTGMILTNAHVASPASMGSFDIEPDVLVVAMVVSEDKPAAPSYQAKVMAVDGYMDLAVIQITASTNGAPIDTSSLNLPYVELGDSDQIRIGDTVNIFGFPSIGGNTITFTKGSVSGFASEDQLGDRAWVKTDATITGGNSGGLAADNNSRIVGVPTIAASGASDRATDCRHIQDTNGDGIIDQNDSCIPIGGFINGLRPVNLAMPLIQAAQAGREYVSPFRVPGVASEPGSGNETAKDFVWLDTSGSTQKCQWNNNIVNSYPGSALCIAAGFEYSGMTKGQLVAENWFLNGKKVTEYSYAWEWDESGLFAAYLPNEGNPVPPGTYYVEVLAGTNLRSLGRSPEVTVGGGGSSQPTQPSQPSGGNTVTVYGIVYDSATNKPLSDVYVFVLTPGTTYDQWANTNFDDKYIVTFLQTGSNGGYKITGIPRNSQFTLVFSTPGYYNAYADNLMADASAPEMNELNVGLNSR
jgi:serine protease Do